MILFLYIFHPPALYVYTVHITLSSHFIVRFIYIIRIFTRIARWGIKEESTWIYNTLTVVLTRIRVREGGEGIRNSVICMSGISFRCTYRYTEMYWSRGEGQLSMADVDCYDFYILKIFSGVTRVIARKRRRRKKL